MKISKKLIVFAGECLLKRTIRGYIRKRGTSTCIARSGSILHPYYCSKVKRLF